MRVLRLASVLAMTAFSTMASVRAEAAAIYEWVSMDCETCSGIIQLSDEAYFAGTAGASAFLPFPGSATNPGNEILQIRFGIGASSYNWGPTIFVGRLGAGLLVDGLGLSGSIDGSNGATDLSMRELQSGSLLWTVERYISDAGSTCGAGQENLCAGWTGYWQLTSAPSRAVPEPETMVIMGGGLLLFRLRRRRQGPPGLSGDRLSAACHRGFERFN
jgi:hypothetical protein